LIPIIGEWLGLPVFIYEFTVVKNDKIHARNTIHIKANATVRHQGRVNTFQLQYLLTTTDTTFTPNNAVFEWSKKSWRVSGQWQDRRDWSSE